MFHAALAALRCPTDRAALNLVAVEANEQAVQRGELVCRECARRYPIRDGIADLLERRQPVLTPAQITNYLPLTAWGYERLWRPHALGVLSGERFGYDRELPIISAYSEAATGGLMLDIACSNGLYARALEQARSEPGHVIALDHSLPMLREGQRLARAANLAISFVLASAQALPLGAGTVRAAVIGGSLNEIGDAGRALREMRRVVAPQGVAALMCLAQAASPPGQWLQAALGTGGIAFYDDDALKSLITAAGWQITQQEAARVVRFFQLQAHS